MEVLRCEGVLIKPCAGKDHREFVELSNLDLIASPIYNKVVYVFEAPTPSSKVLKEGLAKVLAEFREWAGRYTKDTPSGCLGINLNDEGVLVIEGEADGTIADAMPFHPSAFLLKLVPPTSTVVINELLLMQKLKSKVNGSDKSRKPYTTFEILVAYIWKCITEARGLDGDVQTKASISVDGRKRLNPPLPKEFFGNAVYDSSAQTSASEIINNPLEFTAHLIHKSIAKVDDNFIRSAIDFFELRMQSLGPSKDNDGIDVIATSWMNFPTHNFHFGMGEPVYVGPSLMLIEGLIILFDSYTNVGGVEVVVCLSKEHMIQLEHYCFQV
ncbi:hypothetical protein SUGI_1296780 [Cryptomeria japonica]|uniref:Uncharacterized protein n=1 Tax=Cryptomeria japonica TaxID=3369 RepID=A0AAD3NQS0_CRYJA|nr:hypothetical protein SUGI_1296780 [Cryptomeria japonica]